MRERVAQPLASVVSLVTDRVLACKDPSKPYVGLEHIPSSGTSLKQTALAADSISTNGVFAAGDILFGKLRPRLRKSVRVTHAGYCSTDVLVLRPLAGVDSTFASYVAQSDAVFGRAIQTEEGTKMPRCSWRDLRTALVFVPASSAEQQRIASILTSLDNAIEATEALIEKHQQIKAGLMHDLLTRGVLPNGRIGPAVDQLPAGWRWTPLAQHAQIVSGVTLGAGRPANGIDVPYLRVANVQDGYLALSDVKTIRVSRSVLEELRLVPGDVLMNEGGDFDKLGRGTIWAGEIEDCIHQNHVFRVRTNRSTLLPEYLAFHSESFYGKRYFLLSSKQSTNLASINSTQLRRYPVALPPLEEQARIVERLAAANAERLALTRTVAKLRAQKLGLMQDLLSGKVPVTLPDPIPEPAIA